MAGNHDIGLDAVYCRSQPDGNLFRPKVNYNTAEALALFTSPEAVDAGIVYLHDETRAFTLSTGATFTVHGSPWQPAFCDWAFNYPHYVDRWNDPSLCTAIPDNVDILVTHGPPQGILDAIGSGEHVGCPWLKLALERVSFIVLILWSSIWS